MAARLKDNLLIFTKKIAWLIFSLWVNYTFDLTSLQTLLHSIEETFLKDFLEILKHSLKNFKKMLKKYSLDTEWMNECMSSSIVNLSIFFMLQCIRYDNKKHHCKLPWWIMFYHSYFSHGNTFTKIQQQILEKMAI